jgi:rhomboid protease GluP
MVDDARGRGILRAPGDTFWLGGWLGATLQGASAEEARAASVVKPAGGARGALQPILMEAPATLAILAALVACFCGECWMAGAVGDIDVAVLEGLGGLRRGPVLIDGEWYRVVTATLLHGGVLHLALNAFALLLGGALVETMAGSAWMLVLYAVSALGGSALGLLVNAPNLVSVGASGAIMGLLAGALVTTMRFPPGGERTNVQVQIGRFLIPSLLPLATSATGGKIDYAAHAGGAIAGAIVGGLLLAVWPRAPRESRPPFGRAASALAALAILAFAGSAVAAVRRAAPQAEEYSLHAADLLVPDADIPTDMRRAAETVETWGATRPRDPRVHFYRAIAALDRDPKTAERELRAALAEPAVLHKFFGDGHLEGLVRSVLAAVLVDEGRHDEATKEAEPVCKAADGPSRDRVRKMGLCGPS